MGLFRDIRRSREIQQAEYEYSALLPLIASETQEYINHMRNSSVLPELAKMLLADGIPESFTVHETGVSWKYKEGMERSIAFKHMGLPNLAHVHRYSPVIDLSSVWRHCDGQEKSYLKRFLRSTSVGGSFNVANPYVYGISYYDAIFGDPEDSDYRPCINECIVVGVLLHWKMGVADYTYDYSDYCCYHDGIFTRKYPQTRTW